MGRADPRQPPPGLRRRRAESGPLVVRVDPCGSSASASLRSSALPLLTRDAIWPAGSAGSPRGPRGPSWRPGPGRPDRGQDPRGTRLLPGASSPAMFPRGRVIHSPPRPEGRDPVVLDEPHFAAIRWACDPGMIIASRIREDERGTWSIGGTSCPCRCSRSTTRPWSWALEDTAAAARRLVRPRLGPGLPGVPRGDPATRPDHQCPAGRAGRSTRHPSSAAGGTTSGRWPPCSPPGSIRTARESRTAGRTASPVAASRGAVAASLLER